MQQPTELKLRLSRRSEASRSDASEPNRLAIANYDTETVEVAPIGRCPAHAGSTKASTPDYCTPP
jgi:hypothetical protein